MWDGSLLPDAILLHLPLEGPVNVALSLSPPYPYGHSRGSIPYDGRLHFFYLLKELPGPRRLHFGGEDRLVLAWVKKVVSTGVNLEITDTYRTGYVAPEWLRKEILDGVDGYPYKLGRLDECWVGDYWWRRLLDRLRRGGGDPERFELRLDRISPSLHFELLKHLPPETVATVKFGGAGDSRVEYENRKLAVTLSNRESPPLPWLFKFFDTFAGVITPVPNKKPVPPSLQQLARYRIYRHRPDIVTSLPGHTREILFPP